MQHCYILILFFVVLLLNIIPAFAPPTWMVFSFLGFRLPSQIGWTFALVGAAAAATGRFLLGKLSRRIIRNHWLSNATQENINSVKFELERRPKLTFAALLFYAFTPLPSNYLFIAYGLTTLPFIRVVAPFLFGRFVSYYFWTMSSAAVSRRLELEDTEAMAYFSVHFVLTQLALLGLVYAFTRVDWYYLLQRRRCRWLPKYPLAPRGLAGESFLGDAEVLQSETIPPREALDRSRLKNETPKLVKETRTARSRILGCRNRS